MQVKKMKHPNDFSRSYKHLEPTTPILFYEKYHQSLKPHASTFPARIRFFHASPDSPKLDIYVNGRVLIRRHTFQEISETILFSPGLYFIDIYPSDKTWDALISKKVQIYPGEHLLFAAAGMQKKVQLIRYPYDSFVPRQEAKLRFIHLSPDSPPIDIITETGDLFFQDVSFKEATEYIGMTPMTAEFTAKLANEVHSSRLEIVLEPGSIYSLIGTGSSKSEKPIDYLLIADF
ncbi:MAG: DUF4397 domain-containing protein [Bacillales bacterium]|nr:DUF4397 domain-containing protein [Bacillales bacterium]